jgi:hypothetical protein
MQKVRWALWIPHLYESNLNPYQPKYPQPKQFAFDYNPRPLKGIVKWIEEKKAFEFETNNDSYIFYIVDSNPQIGCILLEGYNIDFDKYILEHPFAVKIKEFYHLHQYHNTEENLDGLLPAVVLANECLDFFFGNYWCNV